MLQSAPIQFIIVLDPNGRALMTRDMELIKKIFAEIQSRDDAQLFKLEIHGVHEAILARHLEMLLKAELIEGDLAGAYNDPFPKILVKDLSWAGHDFAAVLANDTVWAKLKKTFSASELTTLPLAIIKDVGMGWAMGQI